MATKKKSKKRPEQKHIWPWIVLILALIGELFFFTWCRVQCTRVGYEISQAKTDNKRLLALQKTLKVEFAHLKSPERIAEIAKLKLGLTMPNQEQMMTIP